MTLEKLIKKWTDRRREIVNPDGFSWDDLGFDEKPEEYDTVDEYLSQEGEFDEGQQTELRIVEEILEDLDKLKKGIK